MFEGGEGKEIATIWAAYGMLAEVLLKGSSIVRAGWTLLQLIIIT